MKLLNGPAIIILFVSMFVLEALYAICDDHKSINFKDSVVNAVIGLIGLMNSSVVKVIIYATYAFLYRFRIFTIPDNAITWLTALMLSDFSYYWFHRASHTINWFWASHVVHHSSEHYNISTAMRESWTSNLTGQFLFWCWLPVIGFQPALVVVAIQIVHLYQIWLHTEFIKKLPGLIEYIFNTPSHHRVHHGSNFRYLDKNHGGVLIIWDRLFGTFQAEEETPVYGITKNIHTHNIFRITFHEWQNMFTNIRHSGSFKDAVRYMFRPPGWSHNGRSKTVRQLRNLRKACWSDDRGWSDEQGWSDEGGTVRKREPARLAFVTLGQLNPSLPCLPAGRDTPPAHNHHKGATPRFASASRDKQGVQFSLIIL